MDEILQETTTSAVKETAQAVLTSAAGVAVAYFSYRLGISAVRALKKGVDAVAAKVEAADEKKAEA